MHQHVCIRNILHHIWVRKSKILKIEIAYHIRELNSKTPQFQTQRNEIAPLFFFHFTHFKLFFFFQIIE